MIILAVDYGDVRTGLAVCDPTETLASPVCSITQRDPARLAQEIAAVAAEHAAQLLVVGLPKNMDGSEGARAEKCIAFATLLQELTGLPTQLQDERLTTVSAHQALNQTNTRGKKRKAVIDQVSAVMILQDYLDAKKHNL
ncbi:MAG: Holliday junction resolvase RuvX [Clostridia bacterium]|nr:Holliday junction resolvase RuvX [Clostridia bacterium]